MERVASPCCQAHTWIELSRSRLAANVRTMLQRTAPGVGLMAVVKANAYGHGATLLAHPLLEAGVTALGVISLEEAHALRACGVQDPIHVLGYVSAERVDEIIRDDLRPVVFSRAFVQALEVAGARSGRTVEVSVKVETGMGRLGLNGAELEDVMELLSRTKHVRVTGLSTHFARSDELDATPTQEQLGRLQAVLPRFLSQGHQLERSHAANSAAALLYPSTHLDMVRCGISLYGLYPSLQTRAACADTAELKPVLEFKTRVVQLCALQPGEAVSYGGTWVAPAQARLAVLPVGYSDGYRRGLSNQSHVMIRGQRAPIRGRICMNLCMADVTGITGVVCGDEVTLISRDPSSGATADDLAAMLGTINYEIVTGLPGSIARVLVP